MVLRKLLIIITFPLLLIAGAGELSLFPFYFITSPYGSLLFPPAGYNQLYLDGFRLPTAVFDLYPQLPPFSLLREEGEGLGFESGSGLKEVFVSFRGDFGLRGKYGPIFLQLFTHREREGREYSLLGIRKWQNTLFYINFYRNYSFFTGKWRNAFFSSLDHHGERFNLFSQLKFYSSNGNNEKTSLLLFNLRGDYHRKIGARTTLHISENLEAGFGKYSWKEDREIYLDETPLMKVSYPGYSYRPFKAETLMYLNITTKNVNTKIGGSLTYIGKSLFPHPYIKLQLTSEKAMGFITYQGIMPPLEALYGLNRSDNPETFYSWSSGWVEINKGSVIPWEGTPGPFHRIRAGIEIRKGTERHMLRMGAFYIRDWEIPEDEGIWEREYETKVYFQEYQFPIWIEENLQKHIYSNFSVLWRERKGAYIGMEIHTGGLHLNSYLSFKETDGTYPFEPFSYYPGDYALHSSAIMNQKNTSPEFVDNLKGEYGWGEGVSLFVEGEYSGKGFELGGYFYLFRNPAINNYLLISGLPQESFYLPIDSLGKNPGDWNFSSGIYMKIKFKKIWLTLEGVNFFKETNVLKTIVDGHEITLYPFPPQRVLLGIGF